jgi:hypothetical protein
VTREKLLTPAGCKLVRQMLLNWDAYVESGGKNRPSWIPEGPAPKDGTRYALVGLLNMHSAKS